MALDQSITGLIDSPKFATWSKLIVVESAGSVRPILLDYGGQHKITYEQSKEFPRSGQLDK